MALLRQDLFNSPYVGVFCAVSDALALLPPGAELLACMLDSPRARSAAEVVAAAAGLGHGGNACDSVAAALERAGERPTLVTGSTYLVAEARKCLGLPGSEET